MVQTHQNSLFFDADCAEGRADMSGERSDAIGMRSGQGK